MRNLHRLSKKLLAILPENQLISGSQLMMEAYNDKVIIAYPHMCEITHPNTIYHLSAFSYANAGDNLLVYALEDSIIRILNRPLIWRNESVKREVNRVLIDRANMARGILIGGGGLFLKDTNANTNSGWQWACSIEELNNIHSPLFILGVGYNRFRGQGEFETVFTENINAVVEKSKMFGMRNHGSIRALQSYLRDDLKEKIIYHPCATTVLSKIYILPPRINNEKAVIALNCAFDRSGLRFGDKYDTILTSIARVMKRLSEIYTIKLYAHMSSDKKICPYLDKMNVPYEVVLLNKPLTVDELLQIYTIPDLVIGMRGHAQMIPFGCRTPILSLISHDKLLWFLEDIGHPEWGVDIFDSDFEEKVFELAQHLIKNEQLIIEQIDEAQSKLWDISVYNIKKMKSILFDNE